MRKISKNETDVLDRLLAELDGFGKRSSEAPLSVRLSFALAADAVRGIRDAGYWLEEADDGTAAEVLKAVTG